MPAAPATTDFVPPEAQEAEATKPFVPPEAQTTPAPAPTPTTTPTPTPTTTPAPAPSPAAAPKAGVLDVQPGEDWSKEPWWQHPISSFLPKRETLKAPVPSEAEAK